MRRPSQQAGATEIATWAHSQKLDVIVWTALPSNFKEKVRIPFSVGEAIAHLQRLPAQAKVKAAEYIRRAPEFVDTRLRKAVQKEPWFTQPQGG